MPELPEVETIARTLAPQITGRRIASVELVHPKTLQAGKELLPVLQGAVVQRVFRRAKLLMVAVALAGEYALPPADKRGGSAAKGRNAAAVPVAETAGELVLAFHLKMTGRFFVYPEGTAPQKHTRLILDLAPAESAQDSPLEGRLFFDDMRTFGYCRVMRPGELMDWPFWAALGPEPLLTPAGELARRFAAHRAGIKGVLLDQRVVAGVGNIYADESLFRAGIAPTAKAADISLPRLTALASALQDILRQSIEECGSSIRDYRDAHGNAGAFQNNFSVYGKKDQPCPTCGAPLKGARVAGRGTVFCAHCQK